ncbi:uncharacterized protein LOC124819244 [Hydra vulgaris]|uniref:uncharacterized protein LOC124819244 n=1 Tax=Hydra vulgaris TaxID=6087 RepID=UPI001F5E8093|nr:uncharacterized protein LOC124819244 [Hydra vulgaris]
MDQKPWMFASIGLDVIVILANAFELILLLKNWRRLDRIEYLLFSLSVSDFIEGTIMLISDVTQVRKEAPKMDDPEALVTETLFLFFIIVSNFHVISIAIERLVAVVLPMKYSIFTTAKCKTFTISFVWTAAILITTIIGIFIGKSKKTQSAYFYFSSVLIFACVSVFMIYFFLACALFAREKRLAQLLPEEMRKQLRDRKTTMFCLLIGCCFLICHLPITLGYLQDTLSHPISSLLVTLNHFLNPFIYFAKSYYAKRERSNSEARIRLISRETVSSRTDSVLKEKSSETLEDT